MLPLNSRACALTLSIDVCNTNATHNGTIEVSLGAFMAPITITAPAFDALHGCSVFPPPQVVHFPPFDEVHSNGNGLAALRIHVPPQADGNAVGPGVYLHFFNASCT